MCRNDNKIAEVRELHMQQTISLALQQNSDYRRTKLTACRTLLTVKGQRPCDATRAAVAAFLGIPLADVLEVTARKRNTDDGIRVLNLTFRSAEAATTAYKNTTTTHKLPENMFLLPKRTHIDDIMNSLLRELRDVIKTAPADSILHEYHLRIYRDRIVVSHIYDKDNTADYPIHLHVPFANLQARLPIQFLCLTVADIQQVIETIVADGLIRVDAARPDAPHPAQNNVAIPTQNRYEVLQQDVWNPDETPANVVASQTTQITANPGGSQSAEPHRTPIVNATRTQPTSPGRHTRATNNQLRQTRLTPVDAERHSQSAARPAARTVIPTRPGPPVTLSRSDAQADREVVPASVGRSRSHSPAA
jgi:hypothetical protein